MTKSMCPHCGRIFGRTKLGKVPHHVTPHPHIFAACPGSLQTPRNPDTDKRPLWKDDPELKETT